MASGKSLFGAMVGRFLFREVRTTEIRDLAPGFRLISFAGDSLRNVSWEAGDKIQVFLPGKGMRTYTPMAWNAEQGSAELLVYVHGEAKTPGAEWGRCLAVGDSWQFFGPRRSVRATDLDRQVVVFGDETSFAVARALSDAKGAANVRCIFEVNDAKVSSDVLANIGLSETKTVAKQTAEEHLTATCDALMNALESSSSASLVLTGRAQSIQLLRARLKARSALRAGKVKAYWSVGKAGLD